MDAHCSDFSQCDSAPSDFSLAAPVDVALWTQSVSGTEYTGSDLFSFGQDDFPSMARQRFFHFPKDDETSISSSMDDSAYVSQPDTGRRVKKENYRMPQDARSHIMEPLTAPYLYSPTLSVQSHGAFSVSQSDIANLMLPPTATSDSGDYAFNSSDLTPFTNTRAASPTEFTFRPPSQAQSWAGESQGYGGPFASSPLDSPTTFMQQRQTSYHSRAASQPFFSQHPAYGIDSMISNDHSIAGSAAPSPFADAFATAAPADVQRPMLHQHDSQSRFDGSDIISPSSNAMTAQFSVFHGGSEYDEDATFMSIAGSVRPDASLLPIQADGSASSDGIVEPEAAQPLAMQSSEPDEDEVEQDIALKSSEEVEVKLARTHPLYQAQPQADEKYHCPFEGQAQCQHKATKLKCNYDKYVDSHLKPFRCKNAACTNVEFSSTACLLRHEREAHGMHGHGSKPHLCAYADCERAIPGNGFPRRYNLYDHMKRVHDYTSPTSQADPTSPRASPTKPSVGRKRKAISALEQSEKRQKAAAQIKQANTARQREQERERLRQSWVERMAVLQQRLHSLQEPKDADGHQQIIDDATALQKIVARLTEMG